MVFGNRVLRERKWWETGEDCIMRSFITCMRQGDQVKDEIVGRVARMRSESVSKMSVGKPEWNRPLEKSDLGIDGRIILEGILEKYCGKLWTGLMWLGIGTSGGL
jgi:hypothetical protein